jgi:hypothetical protein
MDARRPMILLLPRGCEGISGNCRATIATEILRHDIYDGAGAARSPYGRIIISSFAALR